MDDRILLIPPIWAPDWSDRQGRGTAVFLEELKAFLPVDLFEQPTLRGSKHKASDVEGLIAALRSDITPRHHVVEAGGMPGEPVLIAAAQSEARSVTIAGFYPSPRTLARRGENDLANAVQAMYTLITSNPGQAISIVMQGAAEEERTAAVRRIDETADRVVMRQLGEAMNEAQFAAQTPVSVPALYLGMNHLVPANAGMIELFREYAPTARYDELQEWGRYSHLESAGYEFAGKVIAFIKEVIAEREKTDA